MTLYVRLSSTGVPSSTPSPPPSPSVAGQDGQVSVTFTAPTYDGGSTITSYDLRWSVQSAESWTTVTGVTSPATVASLSNGTTYEVQVRAVNAIGNGSWSSSGTGTPAAAAFGYRDITSSTDPAGTSVSVPAGAEAGDTLIFVASRDFDIGGSVSAPSGATAVGTPTDQTGGYPSFLVWRILSWNGSTTSYDFGQSGAWAGERCIIVLQGTASAVSAGTYTHGGGATLVWTGMTMSTGDFGLAIGGLYDAADGPVTSFDGSWTSRRTQQTGEWVGFTLWTKPISSGGTIAPSPAGTMTSANYATLLLRAEP